MLLYIILFITALIYDIIVVLWYRSMQARHVWKAAFYAPVMVLIANFEAKSFVFDNFALIPLCIGTLIGTVIGAKIDDYLRRND